ncbi:hypothetical protein AAC387_Pa12g0575 [Persea americana]
MAGSFAIRDTCPDPLIFSETPPLFLLRLPSTEASACQCVLPLSSQQQVEPDDRSSEMHLLFFYVYVCNRSKPQQHAPHLYDLLRSLLPHLKD